jgi:histidyl-tRNA synthetase
MVYSQAKGIGFKGLNELRKVVEALPREVLNKTEIDLSLACDSDYYTGFVMEGVVVRRSKKDKSVHEQMGKFVLSGGSYKDLVSSFGGKAEPAVGMAFYLENLLDAMEQLGMIDSLDLSRRRVLLSCAEERHASKLLQIGQSLRKNSFEVVTAHEILDNKFKRLKMALEEQCACVVCLDGMISVKPLPGYGSSALFKVLQKILENDGYGDGMSVAVIAEKESGEGELKREMEEIKRLGQPTYKFDPSQN